MQYFDGRIVFLLLECEVLLIDYVFVVFAWLFKRVNHEQAHVGYDRGGIGENRIAGRVKTTKQVGSICTITRLEAPRMQHR